MVTNPRTGAPSTRDLLSILASIADHGAGFQSLTGTWAVTTTPRGHLMLTVLGGLAEFERELIRARTGEGRARAKARGGYGQAAETYAASAAGGHRSSGEQGLGLSPTCSTRQGGFFRRERCANSATNGSARASCPPHKRGDFIMSRRRKFLPDNMPRPLTGCKPRRHRTRGQHCPVGASQGDRTLSSDAHTRLCELHQRGWSGAGRREEAGLQMPRGRSVCAPRRPLWRQRGPPADDASQCGNKGVAGVVESGVPPHARCAIRHHNLSA